MDKKRWARPGACAASVALLTTGLAMTAPAADATPVTRQVRIANTDWTAGGVGGIGSASSGGGTGTITLGGISGKITHAYLTWNGIGPGDRSSGFHGTYDNPSITVDGTAVTGTSQGESGSNCWGDDAYSRTYLADVTSIVAAKGGNGSYDLAGLGDHGDGNGASLVVTYQDADATNNRDLYLYYGNDTDADGYPGEDTVWSDALSDINYSGGVARLLAGVGDGQDFGDGDDGALNVTGPGGTVTFGDDDASGFLWDGKPTDAVADAGHSRADNGDLQDLKSFDITAAFGEAGVQNLQLDSDLVSDCHSLTFAGLDVPATGNQPPAPRTVSVSPASVTEGTSQPPKRSALVFKVTLSDKSTSPTTVTLHTEDGTATSPDDYRGVSRTVTVPAGKRTAKFKVSVTRDSVAEGDEYLYAVIDSASVPVATDAATGQIIDDDQTPSTSSARRAHVRALTSAHQGGIGR